MNGPRPRGLDGGEREIEPAAVGGVRGLVTGTTGSRPVAVARIAVGAAALLKAGVVWPTLLALGEPAVLRAPMASWLPALPADVVPAVIGVWLVSAAAFLLGWRTRLAGSVLAAVMLITLLGDQQLYSNHLYLAVTLTALVTLADAGAALSLDARRRGARPRVRAWPVTLLKLQVTIVYGFAALAKLNLVYISGAVLNTQLGWGSLVAVPHAMRRWEVMSALALLSILAEAFLALALWSARWRPVGYGLGFAFHAAIVVGMDPTGELVVFSILMFALYLLFLEAPVRARVVVWDDACSFCGAWARGLRRLDWLRAHRFVGSSTLDVLPAGITRAEADEALQLVGPNGRAAGFEAVRTIMEVLPISFLWAPYLRNRLIRRAGARAYRAVASRRRCGLSRRRDVGAGA